MWRALLLLLIALPAHADWTPQEEAAATVYALLLDADYAQTRIPVGYEKNPILGRHPSNRRVDTYFAAVGVLSGVVLVTMPQRYRFGTLCVAAVVEAVVVSKNTAYVGFRLRY